MIALRYLVIGIFFLQWCSAQQISYQFENNIQYYDGIKKKLDSYSKERCVLDLYYPTNLKNFATVVWIHGGGLVGGEKYIPERLMNQGFAVVAISYRLYPKVKKPKYIEDAAAAVAWVFKNIDRYGGDTDQIFVSGHSAGGYLTSMVVLDKKWLRKHDIDADQIAGVIPFSGHTITHFTVRDENGISRNQPIVDDYAPLFYIRKDAPPFLLITGDRTLELPGRYEENAYFESMMKTVGHSDIALFEIQGYGHDMTEPGYPLLAKYIKDRTKK
ncbi:alpha/beta hydrolase [Aquimarina sp. U1-2]|uniref:alpha/beta hydrolase n=1 Tax=Aquimarina sp. U1-2 TaxID=2823141 RepID=UPI001AED105E|nr:alpha/beta hydrolase [Aquimarina sp. U1-2]MBP2830878.1 alpha/beta hydrolase [Aquimarina sp. U1-2]